MKSPLQILIAEDNPVDVKLLLRALQQAGFEFQHNVVSTEADYLARLHPELDIVLDFAYATNTVFPRLLAREPTDSNWRISASALRRG